MANSVRLKGWKIRTSAKMPEADDEDFEAQSSRRASCRFGFRRSCPHRPSILTENMGLPRVGLQMQHFADLDPRVARHDDADIGTHLVRA